MHNKEGGLWNPNWITEELNAYPVDNYVYMIKRPFHKPKFYQHEWDAFDDPLYRNHAMAELVRIHVHPTSQKRIEEGQLALRVGDMSTPHAYTIKDKDYFKPVYLKREFWGMIGFFTLAISSIGMTVTDNDWFMWSWVIGIVLWTIGTVSIKRDKKTGTSK